MAQDLHRNALQPGYQALWYRIERILGQGGFGITYLAYDSNLDRQVAIKEYLPIDHALAFREDDRPQSLEEWAHEFGLPDEATVVAPARAELESHPSELTVSESVRAPAGEERDSDASAPPGGKSASIETADADAVEKSLGDRYRQFIGPKNSDYYLARFRDFDRRGGGRYVAWHWPGAITTFLWLLYRRLYLWAFVLYPLFSIALAFLVVIVISVVFFGGGDVPEPVGLAILVLVSSLAGGSYANAVYYRRAKSRIARMQGSGLGAQARLDWLVSRGGVSRRSVIIAVAVMAVFSVLVLVGEQEDSLPRDGDVSELEDQPARDRDERIERLLQLARRDYEALRLSTPAGNNALEKVREVLSLDPGNQKAKDGLRLIVEKYVELAGEAAKRGELHEAEAYLQRALEIAPRSPKLQKAMKRLKRAMGVPDWKP